MKAIVFAVVLLGVVLAAQTQDQAISLIEKIDANSFGHTLFETIHLQLQSGDPLDSLLSTLTDLEDSYVADQKENDQTNSNFQDSCNNDLAALDKDLNESGAYAISVEAKLEGSLYPQRSIYTGIVASKAKEVKELQAQLNELDNDRAETKQEFEDIVTEHNQATAIVTEGRRLIESLSSQSFLQKSQQSKQILDTQLISLVQKHLIDGGHQVSKFQHRKTFGNFFKVLATIASKAQQFSDNGQIERLVNLFNGVLAQISDSLDLERNAEDKRVAAYQKARKLLAFTFNLAQTTLANMQSELASVEDQITTKETALDNTNQRIVILSERRVDRYNECEQAAHDYQQARSTRDENRGIVSQAVGIVNTNLRTLKEQLALRLSAGDNI